MLTSNGFVCSDLKVENLNLQHRLSALETEAHVSELQKKELNFLE